MSYHRERRGERFQGSLYKICMKVVMSHLKARRWNSCSVNPFSNFPSKILDDLLKAGEYDFYQLSEIFPILTSGSLTYLDLDLFAIDSWELDLFQEVIYRNGFKSLRYFSWYSGSRICPFLLTAAIRLSPKLEEFCTGQFLDFDAFENCKELKVLKFDDSLQRIHDIDVSLSSLSSLRGLQVFDTYEGLGDVVAAVLEHCPHLISVGCNDSLNTLEKIHADAEQKRETDSTTIPTHFQLKMCLWGKNNDVLYNITCAECISYKSSFSEKVRNAVSLCPYIERLIIHVSHKDSLDSLKNLEHLTHLKISFWECDDDDYKKSFFSLLRIIGERLKHLAFNDKRLIQVDMIWDLCPNLETLEIGGFVILSGSIKPLCNFKLKKLLITDADSRTLWFLLSSCKGLEELTIENAFRLEDGLLSEVLKLNPLERLRTSDIQSCNLSEEGFQTYLESAVSLEEANFSRRHDDNDFSVVQMLREHNLFRIKNRRSLKGSFTVFF